MDHFRRVAFSIVSRDASFVGLFGLTSMVAFSFHLPLAFLVGANIALVFALFLVFRTTCLTDERVTRSESWRTLDARERPKGALGRGRARYNLEQVWLQSAKAAAGVAVVLAGASLVASAFHGAPSQAFASLAHTGS